MFPPNDEISGHNKMFAGHDHLSDLCNLQKYPIIKPY